jgi:hypothetical protein
MNVWEWGMRLDNSVRKGCDGWCAALKEGAAGESKGE